jgi:hypothetical protein
MNKRSSILILAALFVFIVSAPARAEVFFAYLNGEQEAPTPVNTGATGYARVVLNESTGMISFTVVFTGLTGAQNNAHIHTGAIGVSGPVTINLGIVGGTSGTITGSAAITSAQIAAMRAHQFYVNVHSSTFGNGEIRGQLGIKRPVDFDGDGRQDFSVLRFPATGSPRPITYWNLNSTAGASVFQNFGDVLTDFPAPGDYDGDGKDDICLYRDGATAGAQSFFYYVSSLNGTFQTVAFGLNGDQVVARDYDGDGITDMAIYRRGATALSQADWWIRKSTGGGAQSRIPFGLTSDSSMGDTPIPGDYDGDGKFDLAVYRYGGLAPNNHFIILRSSDNIVAYQQFGDFTSDYILPGDYDGDGKFDYAIARTGGASSSPMVWWILQSSNGLVRVQQFGISSDLPTQGDYDGDARTDMAVYRAGAGANAQSVFWVFRSFDNTAQPTPWGVGADFPVATFDAR